VRLLRAGEEVELGAELCARKDPTLVVMDDFSLASLGQRFDWVLAQSLFTHLDLATIGRCLAGVAEVLGPGGRFYATFFEPELGRSGPTLHAPGGVVTYPDRDPFHYDFDVLDQAARGVGLRASNLGSWSHPRDQKMMLFRRARSE
jgi:hypothetical protein